MIQQNNRSRVVDAANRLLDDGTYAYSYDPNGRRIQKSVNGVTTKYLYDNEDIISEYDGGNNLTAYYIHGPGIDEPLILEKAGQKYYYHTDSLGSVECLFRRIK